MLRFSLVLAIFALGTLLSFQGPALAASLFLWNNLFRPLEFSRHAGAFPSAYYVLVFLLVSYAFNWARGRFVPRANFLVLAWIPFVGWMYLTVVFSNYRAEALAGFFEILKYILPLLLISTALEKKQDFTLVLAAVALSIGIWSAQAGVYSLAKGTMTQDVRIPGAQMSDNNDFMAGTVSTIPMLLYFAFSYRGVLRKWAKPVLLAMAVSAFIGVIFSGSRGAAIGLAGIAVLYIVLVSRRRIRDSVLLGFAAVLFVFVTPQDFYSRMGTIEFSGRQTEASAMKRVNLAKAAYRATMDNPLFGVGPHCWILVAERYSGAKQEPHNAWLKTSVELGIPGLMMYAFIILLTLGRLFRLRRQAILDSQPQVTAMVSCLILSTAGFILPSTFLSHPFSEFFWAQMAIANALISRYPEWDKEEEREAMAEGALAE